MTVDQPSLVRRDFLIRVLVTLGMKAFVLETGFKKESVLKMSIGHLPINNEDIETIYLALSRVTACQKPSLQPC